MEGYIECNGSTFVFVSEQGVKRTFVLPSQYELQIVRRMDGEARLLPKGQKLPVQTKLSIE